MCGISSKLFHNIGVLKWRASLDMARERMSVRFFNLPSKFVFEISAYFSLDWRGRQ